MEDRETARMRKYGESKTTRIMMATVPHVTSGLGLRKFQADGFLLTKVYLSNPRTLIVSFSQALGSNNLCTKKKNRENHRPLTAPSPQKSLIFLVFFFSLQKRREWSYFLSSLPILELHAVFLEDLVELPNHSDVPLHWRIRVMYCNLRATLRIRKTAKDEPA